MAKLSARVGISIPRRRTTHWMRRPLRSMRRSVRSSLISFMMIPCSIMRRTCAANNTDLREECCEIIKSRMMVTWLRMAATMSDSERVKNITNGGSPVGRYGRPHVVVIGAGFGGLRAAKALRDAEVDVTLVD